MRETKRQLRERLRRAEELADERLGQIQEIQQSISWRITEPLRAAKRRFRRFDPELVDPEQPADEHPPPVPTGGFTPSGEDRDGLKGRPWRTSDLPPEPAGSIPAMIIDDERRLLHWLARDYWSGAGKIVDAGSYLGASTAALASGIAARDDAPSDRPVVAYDRFLVDYFMLADLPPDSELDEGDSFRPLFDRNLEPYAEFVEVREGDLRVLGWSGEPIEVLFLDILKTWPLNDFVLANFFGSLIPGRSILVQQDFVGEFCPWVHVTMGMLDPYVELLDLLEWGSAVYIVREPISERMLNTRTARDLTPDEIVEFMDVAIAPATGEIRGTLEVAKATLLRWVEGLEAMDAHLDRVEAEYEGSYRVMRSAEIVRSWGLEMAYGKLRLRGRRGPETAISPPA